MFRYLLVPATGQASDRPVFKTALSIARIFSSHICFLHVCASLDQALISLARAANGPIVDTLGRYIGPGDERLAAAQQEFRDFRAAGELPGPDAADKGEPSAELKVEAGVEVLRLAEYGCAADLLVIGRVRESEAVAMALLDTAILETGRPVLLVPETIESVSPRTIAIAWNGSVPAARAVANALSLIDQAERVVILVVAEEGSSEHRSATLLLEAIRRHQRDATVVRLAPDSRPIAETLLAAARDAGADLLVMGAYGHTPLREIVLGGCTRRVLHSADLPVFLSH